MSLTVIVTGASSYTGSCIAAAFAGRGHRALGLCRRSAAEYGDLEARRLQVIRAAGGEIAFGIAASELSAWLDGRTIDVWVHHHHPMENFRSPAYDVAWAERVAIDPLGALVPALARAGARAVVYSSTYFEPGEGGRAASEPVTPYAATKAAVYAALAERCTQIGLPLSRVVIPAPSGALENTDRLTPQLLRAAREERPFLVASPESVMDVLPGESLAEVYVRVADETIETAASRVRRPSGRVTTAWAWAEEVRKHLAEPLGLSLTLSRGQASVIPPAHFENPASERMDVDWDEFFRAYARDYRFE